MIGWHEAEASQMTVTRRERPRADPLSLDEIVRAEQTIIGRVLRDNAEYAAVAELLRPEDFTERLHWGVYERARDLIEAGKPATLDCILAKVARVGLGGELARPYLARLAAQAPPDVDLRAIARSLAKAARERRTRAPEGTGYEEDFYTWANEQAERLRRGEWSRLDALNLAEEIEDLGRELYNRLESAYRIILLHLLKWDRQPGRRSRSWAASIEVQRIEISDLLENHRGLEPRVEEAVRRAYRRARIEAAAETNIDSGRFPPENPYSVDEIMTRPTDWPPT